MSRQWAKRGAASQIFVGQIEPAGEGHAPIRNDDLAVIAEIDLQPRLALPDGVKIADVDPGLAQPVKVSARDAVTAKRVIKHMDPDPGPGTRDQPICHLAPQGVIGDRVKLDQDVFLGPLDRAEDGAEGLLPVDQ